MLEEILATALNHPRNWVIGVGVFLVMTLFGLMSGIIQTFFKKIFGKNNPPTFKAERDLNITNILFGESGEEAETAKFLSSISSTRESVLEQTGNYEMCFVGTYEVGPARETYYKIEMFSESYLASKITLDGKFSELEAGITEAGDDFLIGFLELFYKITPDNPYSTDKSKTLYSTIANELQYQSITITFYSQVSAFVDLPLNNLTARDFGIHHNTLTVANGGRKYE